MVDQLRQHEEHPDDYIHEHLDNPQNSPYEDLGHNEHKGGGQLREHAKDAVKDKAKQRIAQHGARRAAEGATRGAGAAAGKAAAGAAARGGAVAAGGTAAGGPVGTAVAAGIMAANFIRHHKKGAAAFVVVLVTGGLVLLVVFLNIFKPIAATTQTTAKYMGPVQQIVDERTISILAKFAVSVGGGVAHNGNSEQQVAANGGHVLGISSEAVTQGKLKKLFDTMKEANIEEGMKKKYGLEFKPGNGNIQIHLSGRQIGIANNAKEAETILRERFPYLQRLLAEDINGWSWAQHVKGARNMKGQYQVALSVPNAEKARDEAAFTEIVKYQFTTILRSGLDNMRRGIACFTGGTECNELGAQVPAEAVAEFQTDERSSLSSLTKTTHDENIKNISPENGYNAPRLDSSAGKKVAEQVESKAVGLLGWLDIAATTKAMSDKDGAQQLPSIIRTKQAGALYLMNLSSINQQLGDDMTSPAASLLTRNYKDIEGSQAYGYVAYNDATRGKGMNESQKVQSKVEKSFSYIYQAMVTENPVIDTTLSIAFKAWLIIHNSPAGILIDLAARTGLGSFLDHIGAFILDKIGILPLVGNIIGMSSQTLLPICDPADRTYNFFNCFATGAHAAANFTCTTYFGCGKITLAQDIELKTASQRNMNERLAAMPLERRLFDQTMPNSFINVAAMHSPIPIKATDNVASLFQNVFGAVWSAPSKVASLSSAHAHAASADSSLIDGVDNFGIPLDTIHNAPLANELISDQGKCPDTKPGELNMCKADTSTVDSLIARFTQDPAYGG